MTTYYVHAPTFNRFGILDVYAINLRVAHAPSHFAENRSLWRHVGYVNAQGMLCLFQGPALHEHDLLAQAPLRPGTSFFA